MVDRETRNGFRRRKSNIYRHAPASIFFEVSSSPAKHATAGWAEVNFQGGICPAGACVDGARPPDANPPTFIVVGPQRTVAATKRAVARGYRARIAVQAPIQCATMASAIQHGSFSSKVRYSQATRQQLGPGLGSGVASAATRPAEALRRSVRSYRGSPASLRAAALQSWLLRHRMSHGRVRPV